MRKSAQITAFVALFLPAILQAQKMSVKIIDRRTSDTNYTYQVPGHAYSTSGGGANCNANSYGNSTDINCSGSSTTSTQITAPREVSFSVTGATFALLLPDGRIAVVNCVSKFVEHFAGPTGNHRSCRMPIVDDIQTEFNGKNAKLSWPVSLDGKKMESETYTILGLLPTPQPAPSKSPVI